jgi:peptidoglycan/LPS O-acetylase OafA/YrhL
LIVPVFLSAVLVYIFQSKLPTEIHLYFITNNLVFFVFGVLLNSWAKPDFQTPKYLLPVTLLGFISAQYLFHSVYGLTFTDQGAFSLLVALISILFVVALSMTLAKWPVRFFMLVGSSSMAIYLIHVLVGSGTRIILMKVLEINQISIHLLVGMVTGIAVPLIIALFIDKYHIPFVFSAPVSRVLQHLYDRAFHGRPQKQHT